MWTVCFCWDMQIQVSHHYFKLRFVLLFPDKGTMWTCESFKVGCVTIQCLFLLFLDDELCHFGNFIMKTRLPAHQRVVGIRGYTCTVVLLFFMSEDVMIIKTYWFYRQLSSLLRPLVDRRSCQTTTNDKDMRKSNKAALKRRNPANVFLILCDALTHCKQNVTFTGFISCWLSLCVETLFSRLMWRNTFCSSFNFWSSSVNLLTRWYSTWWMRTICTACIY